VSEQSSLVKCNQCGKVLDEPSGTPLHGRTPCPDCGSTARRAEKEIADASTTQSSIRGKGRDRPPGQPGSKSWLKMMSEPSWFRDGKKWVHREKIEDRRNNWYTETVTDPDTGEIIHHHEEPLTDHRGHGSAKKKKNS
jgi:predicted  nucleic acid-binding Zn-ribbon protein